MTYHITFSCCPGFFTFLTFISPEPSINDFIFPKSSDYVGVDGEAKNGYVLKYRWFQNQAYGFWESAFSQSITGINYPSGTVTITGQNIVLDGYNFTDDTIVATAIGGINAGETFSNVDVLDMIRRIVYTYVPPRVSSYLSYNSSPISLIESGNLGVSNNLKLNYYLTINSTYSVKTIQVKTVQPSVTTGFPLSFPGSIQRGETNGLVNANFPASLVVSDGPYKIWPFTFSVTDTYESTRESSSVVKVVLPYYYGTIATFSNTTSFLQPGFLPEGLNLYLGTGSLSSVNKLKPLIVDPIIGSPTYSNNQSLNITTQGLGPDTGQGYIYFGYPSSYPLLKEIIDYSGFPLIGNFSTYSVKISSPNSYWQSREYIFYVYNNITTVPYKPVPWNFMFVTQSMT